MNAGLLPLVDQGWLWPRTGFETWRRIGPMMPGERPVEMLAQQLAGAFRCEMADVHERLAANEDGLRLWLRSRIEAQTAFLLAIDQFEELFAFADPDERGRFDRLLAAALADPDCPLFVISTVRSDFLDHFDELLPRLVPIRNRLGQALDPAADHRPGLARDHRRPRPARRPRRERGRGGHGRRGPGRAGRAASGAECPSLAWQQRTDDRLSGRLLNDHGCLAGILSRNADDLLLALGQQRDRALELLFRLVKVDAEGRRHTRQRMPLADAVAVVGGGTEGRALVDHLAGRRAPDDPKPRGPLRLITVADEAEDPTTGQQRKGWVNLIHETLIRSKGLDAKGQPQPYWPTLWQNIEQHQDRAAPRERLQLLAREWKGRRGLARLFGLAGWAAFLGYRRLAAPGSLEARYLRWSMARSLCPTRAPPRRPATPSGSLA